MTGGGHSSVLLFRLSEEQGDCHTSVATLARNDSFYFSADWLAMTYIDIV